jgi:hypothetical protein
MTVFVGNTMLLELQDLTSEIDDATIDDATVEVTVKDMDGAEVSGVVWPLAMDYVAGSNGLYRAVLDAGLPLVAKKRYIATVDADGGPDRQGHWELLFVPKTRTG